MPEGTAAAQPRSVWWDAQTFACLFLPHADLPLGTTVPRVTRCVLFSSTERIEAAVACTTDLSWRDGCRDARSADLAANPVSGSVPSRDAQPHLGRCFHRLPCTQRLSAMSSQGHAAVASQCKYTVYCCSTGSFTWTKRLPPHTPSAPSLAVLFDLTSAGVPQAARTVLDFCAAMAGSTPCWLPCWPLIRWQGQLCAAWT